VTRRTAPLRPGDAVRFVSPASPPDRASVEIRAKVLESWGLRVEIGPHAFDKTGFLAGSDDDRLSDVNDAFRDPDVRAVFATRGGKGSYRIAHRLVFDAVRKDPKPLIGFSDITALHLSLWKNASIAGIHGTLTEDEFGVISEPGSASLHRILMTRDPIVLEARATEPTAVLTTTGRVTGPVIGGNLDMLATTAGWALPPLKGAILLIEAVGLQPGQMDRPLTMLRLAGHFDGIVGVAIGRFTDCPPDREHIAAALLREHLAHHDVPILGGLPVGHGAHALSVPVGETATLDADAGKLTFREEQNA